MPLLPRRRERGAHAKGQVQALRAARRQNVQAAAEQLKREEAAGIDHAQPTSSRMGSARSTRQV